MRVRREVDGEERWKARETGKERSVKSEMEKGVTEGGRARNREGALERVSESAREGGR